MAGVYGKNKKNDKCGNLKVKASIKLVLCAHTFIIKQKYSQA